MSSISIQLLQERYDNLYNFSRKVPSTQSGTVPWLSAFKTAFAKHGRCTFSEWSPGDVPDITFDSEKGQHSDSGMWIKTAGSSQFLIEQHIIDKINFVASDLKLDIVEIISMIDNYLIHEFLHRVQGFEDGKHRGVGAMSLPSLLKIDYEADSYAVLIQLTYYTDLNLSKIENLRQMLCRCIKSTIHQTHIFKYYAKTTDLLVPHKSLIDRELGYQFEGHRITRWASWHFQYYRVQLFNDNCPIELIQLPVMPILSFKGIYPKEPIYTRTVESFNDGLEDVAIEGDPFEIVEKSWGRAFDDDKATAFSNDGSNVFAVCVTNHRICSRSIDGLWLDEPKFDTMIQGIITGELSKTRAGMESVLRKNDFFLGYPYEGPNSGPDTGDTGSILGAIFGGSSLTQVTLDTTLAELKALSNGSIESIAQHLFYPTGLVERSISKAKAHTRSATGKM